jgi:hypothetical protein
MNGEPEPATPVEPSPPAEVAGGLFTRVREHLSLSRVQAIFGILAALLSIGGALYGYLRPARTQVPHSGEIVRHRARREIGQADPGRRAGAVDAEGRAGHDAVGARR